MAEVIIRSRVLKSSSIIDDVLVPFWITEWQRTVFAKTMPAAKAVARKLINKQFWLEDPNIPSHVVIYPINAQLTYMDVEPIEFTFRGERWLGAVDRSWRST